MRATHQFNRRLAAIGAALALAALPISGTLTPALAQPSPTPSAEAGSAGTADTAGGGAEATGEADGSKSSESDSGTDTDSDAGADSDVDDSADTGATKVEGSKDGNPDSEPDRACSPPDERQNPPAERSPCEVKEPVAAEWDKSTKTLRLPSPTKNENSMPESWEGETFQLRRRSPARVPAQDSADIYPEGSPESSDRAGETDDSGNPVPSATSQEPVPNELKLRSDGFIVPADGKEPVTFTGFTDDPEWKLDVKNGKVSVVSGRGYPDSDDGASNDETGGSKNGTAESTTGKNGTDSPTADDDPEANADGSSSNTSDKTADSDNGSSSSNDTSNDGNSSKDGATSSDSSTSTDSGAKDQSNSSANRDSSGKDSDDRDSNSDTGSRADASDSGDSAGSGSEKDSDADSGKDKEKKDADKNGSGSSLGPGTADADGTTPDPSNGNGAQEGRATVPGTAGDDWLPSDEPDTHHPDYSDPVPRNPDEQTPKDDRDLITGGDRPSPRANPHPAASFGESIVSTIVSSWPVFVLAAFGMAAVGFIIYLMGRRGKQ